VKEQTSGCENCNGCMVMLELFQLGMNGILLHAAIVL